MASFHLARQLTGKSDVMRRVCVCVVSDRSCVAVMTGVISKGFCLRRHHGQIVSRSSVTTDSVAILTNDIRADLMLVVWTATGEVPVSATRAVLHHTEQ